MEMYTELSGDLAISFDSVLVNKIFTAVSHRFFKM